MKLHGNCNINYKIIYSGEYTIIKLYGEKEKDIVPEKLEDNLFTNREFGPFYLNVPLKTEDYFIQISISYYYINNSYINF